MSERREPDLVALRHKVELRGMAAPNEDFVALSHKVRSSEPLRRLRRSPSEDEDEIDGSRRRRLRGSEPQARTRVRARAEEDFEALSHNRRLSEAPQHDSIPLGHT